MKIDFGFNKVAIYGGVLKDDNNIGVCKLQKILIPEDETSICDVPCTMYFHNVKSLDALIRVLKDVRKEMKHEK